MVLQYYGGPFFTNTVRKKDEKPHTASLYDTAVSTLRFKIMLITKILHKKRIDTVPQYHKPQFYDNCRNSQELIG